MIENDNSIKGRLRMLNDDELRKIIYINNLEYREDVIEIAKNELFSRYTKNIWESNCITLKDLLNYSDSQNIIKMILTLYPDEKDIIDTYKGILMKLIGVDVSDKSDILIIIEKCNRSSNLYNLDWKVYGKDLRTDEYISLEYCDWEEWLSFQVQQRQLQQIGKEAYIAHCMKAMVLISFDEEEIRQKYNEIENLNRKPK